MYRGRTPNTAEADVPLPCPGSAYAGDCGVSGTAVAAAATPASGAATSGAARGLPSSARHTHHARTPVITRILQPQPAFNQLPSTMFQSLKDGASKLGQNLKEGAEAAKEKTLNTIDKHRVVLDNFKTGNIVMLVSRSSGEVLQALKGTVDGRGKGEPENGKWTVVDMGGHTCRLHNNNNFLAIEDGVTKLLNFPDPAEATPPTHFRLENNEQFVSFESFTTAGHHVGILNDGDLKPALATGKENDSHFAVKLCFDANPEVEEPASESK